MIDEMHNDFSVYQSAPRPAHESDPSRAQLHNPIKSMKMCALRINQYCDCSGKPEGMQSSPALRVPVAVFPKKKQNKKTSLWLFQSKTEHIRLVSPVEQHTNDTVSSHTHTHRLQYLNSCSFKGCVCVILRVSAYAQEQKSILSCKDKHFSKCMYRHTYTEGFHKI